MASAVNVPLRDADGSSVGALSISALPGREGPQDREGDPARTDREPGIQLREERRTTTSLICKVSRPRASNQANSLIQTNPRAEPVD